MKVALPLLDFASQTRSGPPAWVKMVLAAHERGDPMPKLPVDLRLWAWELGLDTLFEKEKPDAAGV